MIDFTVWIYPICSVISVGQRQELRLTSVSTLESLSKIDADVGQKLHESFLKLLASWNILVGLIIMFNSDIVVGSDALADAVSYFVWDTEFLIEVSFGALVVGFIVVTYLIFYYFKFTCS